MDALGPAIAIDAFEGPLDLLLHLVRVHEVDIHDIPVAQIAEQYMAAIADLSSVDIDTAGDFLVMAATLAEIKSKVVAAETLVAGRGQDRDPDAPDRGRADGQAQDDPRAELVRQLLEYKRLRDRADALQARLDHWQWRVRVAPALRPSLPKDDPDQPSVDLEDLSLQDLVEAFERIASAIEFERLGDHQVTDDDTPIELHQADAVDRLERARAQTGRAALPLAELFTGRTRSEAIGMFLAILELIRNLRLRAWRQGPGVPGVPGGSAGSTTADAQTAATDSAGVWIGLVEPTHGRDEPADDPALDEQAEHNEQAEHADDNARAS